MSDDWIGHKVTRMESQNSTQYSPVNSQLAKELRAELGVSLAVEKITVVTNYMDGNVSLYLPDSQNGWYQVGQPIPLDN